MRQSTKNEHPLLARHGVEIVHPVALERDIETGDLGVRYVQEKMNGIRLVVSKDESGIGLATTRSGQTGDLWGMASTVPCMAWLRQMPAGTVVDGELWSPGKEPASILPMLRSEDAATLSSLRFTAFAVPRYRGIDLEEMEFAERAAHEMDLPFVPTRRVRGLTPAGVRELLREARERGIEGFVAKREHLRGWMKIKPVDTSDLRIESWSQGKVSITLCGVRKDGVRGSVSTREHLGNPDALLGWSVEVAHEGVTEAGYLRFPRMVRLREDLGCAV